MPLTGKVDFTGTIGYSTPANMFPIIGGDGKHYVAPTIITAPFGIPCAVGQAESNSVTLTMTEAQWRIDLASLGMGTSGTYNQSAVVPAVGTPYFFVVGGGSVAAANWDHNVGVRYKIDNTGTAVVDGGFANIRSAAGGLLFNGGSVGNVFGAQVIGTHIYAPTFIYNPGNWLRNYVVKYDLSGTDANLTIGSWEARVTRITAWDDSFFLSSTSRQYYNRCSLLDLGDGTIRLFAYAGVAETSGGGGGSTTMAGLSGPTLLSCVVDPVLHTCTASSDVSAVFGIPFSDAGLNYAGAAGTSRDDYTSPSILGSEIIFGREFSDNRQYARLRRRKFNSIANVTDLGQTTFQFTSEVSFSSDLEFVMAYRESNDLLVTARDTRNFFFGQITLPLAASSAWIPKVRHI